MVYKCKICGGTVSINQESGIVICDYCGTKQVLPQFTNDSTQVLYERGNHYLLQNEYDKAENIFNQLLSLNPQDPELYWDLVLCKYGVTFVCDPQTGKYIPTCNRTHFESIFHDKNYQKAIQFSTPEKEEVYKADAETINNIQKGILELSRKEKPFDIFISYKETDASGNRSKDSITAQNLYEKLSAEGYKVFFSRITLEDKIGTQYEPYIYAALSSSKVMLTVCSSKEYIEAPWVKNEWSRFLTLRQNDSSKTLIPLYYDMPKSDLPEEFAILSAQDMNTAGFEQELIRGIKKLIPLPIMLAQRRKQMRKRLGIASAILGGILIVAGLISYPWLKSYVTYNKAYKAAMELYDNGSFVEAAAAFEEIPEFKNANKMKQTAENSEKERIATEQYDAAMQLYYDGKYPQAAWAFRDINSFKDSAEMQKKAEKAWRESVATIATSNSLGSSSFGSYYISANGTVETFNYDPGTSNNGIEINQHGKIVSIGDGYPIYALYEDGYLYRPAVGVLTSTELEDIIQILPVVALKNDGTVIIFDEGDSWSGLEEVSTWKNIVSLSWECSRFGFGGFEHAILAGVDVDGNIHSVYYLDDSTNDRTGEIFRDVQDFLASLKNVQKVSVYYFLGDEMCAAALDRNGVLHIYDSGNIDTVESVCDFETNWTLDYDSEIYATIYITDSRHRFSILGSNKTILEDVVYLNKDFLVTQSGTIYYNYTEQAPTATEGKTQIKDVWLERYGVR